MISTRSWPEPAIRMYNLAQSFRKFLIVGAVGLAVQQVLLFLFHNVVHLSRVPSFVIAIAISMAVTFLLNEKWTWHDRGSGSIVGRLMYYVPINTIGLLIAVVVAEYSITFFPDDTGIYVQLAGLLGAGVAAVWNFTGNHFVTWRS